MTNCNVIKDLLPLHIDGCCSEESAKLINEHLQSCSDCQEVYECMSKEGTGQPTALPAVKLSRINDWKASLMQSILLFVSFALITIGVALEAATPSGLSNGYWAVSLVIPATGFLLSLANWYFVRLYKNQKSFSNCSLLATLGITVCSYIWAVFHYQMDFVKLLPGISFVDFIDMLKGLSLFFGIGILLTAVCCVLSKLLSKKYAKMLGKE